jgi:hypothetical protein
MGLFRISFIPGFWKRKYKRSGSSNRKHKRSGSSNRKRQEERLLKYVNTRKAAPRIGKHKRSGSSNRTTKEKRLLE